MRGLGHARRQELAGASPFRGAPGFQRAFQLAAEEWAQLRLNLGEVRQGLQGRYPHDHAWILPIPTEHPHEGAPLSRAQPKAGQQLRQVPAKLLLVSRSSQREQLCSKRPYPERPYPSDLLEGVTGTHPHEQIAVPKPCH